MHEVELYRSRGGADLDGEPKDSRIIREIVYQRMIRYYVETAPILRVTSRPLPAAASERFQQLETS
jgi:hypothetical protein